MNKSEFNSKLNLRTAIYEYQSVEASDDSSDDNYKHDDDQSSNYDHKSYDSEESPLHKEKRGLTFSEAKKFTCNRYNGGCL
jgi:hypothetical protein